MSHLISAYLYSHDADTIGRLVELPLADIVPAHQILPTKKHSPCFSFAIKDPQAPRKDENVHHLTAAVFDLDHYTQDEAAEVLVRVQESGIASMWYTTWRCFERGEEDWRFRVILLPDRPILTAEWAPVWNLFNHTLFLGKSDPKCRNPARIYYQPAYPAERRDENHLREFFHV